MILTGASMTNREYLLGLFSIFFITTTIFAGKSRVLWDFGVVIKISDQQSSPEKNIISLSNSKIEASSQIRALIADPFISPTISDILWSKELFEGISLFFS